MMMSKRGAEGGYKYLLQCPKDTNMDRDEELQEISNELHDRFDDFLDCRGVSKGQAAQAQLRPLSGRAAQKLTGVPFELGGVCVPFLDEHGNPVPDPLDPGHNLFQIRRFEADEDGSAVEEPGKYIGRSGGGWDLYVPPTFDFHSKRLVITEGPLKALIATLHGIPTIALPGVSMFADPVKRQKEKAEAGPEGIETPLTPDTPLLPKLIEISRNRQIAVVFDADGRTNPDVANAAKILADAIQLQASPAKVVYAFIPAEVGFKGIDDWLQYTHLEAVRAWVDDLIFCDPALIYFADALEVRNDPSKKLYITFSPNEANQLAERQYGSLESWKERLANGEHVSERDIPPIDPEAISLNVFTGRYRYLNDHVPLDLSGIDWAQREVVLCPSSDVWQRGDEKKALYALGRELAANGASVDVIKFAPLGKQPVQMIEFLDEKCHLKANADPPSLTIKAKNRKPKPALEHPTFNEEAAWWPRWYKDKQRAHRTPHAASHEILGALDLPEGYRLSDDQTFEFEERNNNGASSWRRLCPAFKMEAFSSDEKSEEWGRQFRIIDHDGNVHGWIMPARLLTTGDGQEIRQRFFDFGCAIEPSKAAQDAFLRLLNKWHPTARVRSVSQLGWQSPALYALPDGAIGYSDIPITVASEVAHNYRRAGTLADWQQHVGRFCEHNSRLILGVCSVFASMLLYHTHDESFGVHFKGDSSIGKSTALYVGGSISGGGGRRGFLDQWKATSNGLESVAALHSDNILCLDEIGQVSPLELGKIAYDLANGMGKRRSRPDGSGRPVSSWNVIFLSSGEVSLEQKMQEAGGHRGARIQAKAGQETRMLQIPAEVANGFGLFEDLIILLMGGCLRIILRPRPKNIMVMRDLHLLTS
jgi:Domain of unknown function (DUF927)/Domain of unknown function (DUF3854)